MINTEELKRYISSGATLTADLQPITIKRGFMVSILGYEKTFKPSEIDRIKATILTYKYLLKTSQYIGIWYNQEKHLVYIDISRHYNNKQDAVKSGVKNRQYAIYNLQTKQDIPLTRKTYSMYYYNRIKNDLRSTIFHKEYLSIDELKSDLKMSYNTLSNYIIKSIDEPIKKLYQDKYVIVQNDVYIREIEELQEI